MVKTTTISYNETWIGEVHGSSIINIIEFSEVLSQRHYSSVPSSMPWIWAERGTSAAAIL
jgi:hypothetical protein